MLQRLGRASARHPRRTLVVWLIVVVASFAAAPALFSSLTSDMGGGGAASESARAEERLDELSRALPSPDPSTRTGPTLIGVVDGVPVDDAATESAVTRASDAIAALPGVESVLDAYRVPDPSLRATDGQASVVLVTLAVAPDDLDGMVDAVQAELERTGAPTVLVGHEDMAGDEIDAQAEEDLVRGETIAMPLAFVALVVVFGGLLAAVLPLALALVSVAGAIILLAIATAGGDMAVYSINVVTMFGVGLGIDYGLIVISRFREERALGSVPVAIDRTIATAGRTVGYSGLTVAVALSGLLVFDSSGLRSLALGGIGVVLVAVLAGVTLLPALLALTGRRIRPSRSRTQPGMFWHIATWVRRRAVAVVLVVGVGLIAAAIPFLHARFENPDARSLPRSSVARQLEETRERFPAAVAADPIMVVVSAPPDDFALAAWVAAVEARDDVAAVDVDGFLAAAGASVVEVVPAGPAQGEQAQALVAELRALDAPFETLVTGDVAELVDLKASIAARLPLALAIVGLATMVLLFLMTGSVVVALKAVLMNVLSLGATFGVLVWVFQDGHLSGLLGFDAVGALDATVPLVVFLFAFGLSMDYEVFLLARIKEAWDETGDNDVAIATGLDRTGRIITSAAALLIIVFAGFAAGELVLIKLLGVGMAVAVIVDVTIVRTLLVPATMTLMGRWNWWSPEPLRRLHARFRLEERAPTTVAEPFCPSEPAPSGRF